MFLKFLIAVIFLSVVDRGFCASVVNVTDSVLTVKNPTKLDNSTKPINASDAQSNMKVRFADLKLKKQRFNVTSRPTLSVVNSTSLNSTSDFSLFQNASIGERALKVPHLLLKNKLKANMTHTNVSNSSSHLNSTGNSTLDVSQMKNASKIVERGLFVVMFDNNKALLDFANTTAEDMSPASDFSLPMNASSVVNVTEFEQMLNGSTSSNSSASLGEL